MTTANALGEINSNDLEAKIKQREAKIIKIIDHVEHANPRNMHWDRLWIKDHKEVFIGDELRERLNGGGAKLKGYHGFDMTSIGFYHLPEGGARIILEYEGKVVLNLTYTNSYKDTSWGRDKTREILVETYKKGPWEAAFDKIIGMGFDKAMKSYKQPYIDKAEKAEEERIRKFNEKLKHNELNSKARRVGL